MPDHLHLTFTTDELEAFELLADMVQEQINADMMLEVKTITKPKQEETQCIMNTTNR